MDSPTSIPDPTSATPAPQFEESIAVLNAYLALVRVLHKKGVIEVDDLVVEFGNIIDMSTKHKLNTSNLLYQRIIYDTLVKMAASLDESGIKPPRIT